MQAASRSAKLLSRLRLIKGRAARADDLSLAVRVLSKGPTGQLHSENPKQLGRVGVIPPGALELSPRCSTICCAVARRPLRHRGDLP
jgi:hypothetical protein